MYNVSKCLLRTSNFIIERRKEKNFIAACESLFSMIWRLVNVTMDKYFEIYICACCIVCVVKWNCSQTFAPNCQFNCNCCTNMIYTFFTQINPTKHINFAFINFLGIWNFSTKMENGIFWITLEVSLHFAYSFFVWWY